MKKVLALTLAIVMILAVLPACLDLLYQYRGVFTGSDAEADLMLKEIQERFLNVIKP